MTRDVARRAGAGTEEDARAAAVRRARQALAERRLRNRVFGEDLFGEPVWEMLLTLFLADDQGIHTSVSDLCGQMAVPTTTAHRWMLTLLDRGLLVRIGDPTDRRRSHVYLSATALRQMGALLGDTAEA